MDLIQESTPAIIALALEYGKLAFCLTLSESQADRMEELLELANDEPILSFWIFTIDYCLGTNLESLDEDDYQQHKNQQTMLTEYLGAVMEKYPNQKLDVHHLSLLPRGTTQLAKELIRFSGL